MNNETENEYENMKRTYNNKKEKLKTTDNIIKRALEKQKEHKRTAVTCFRCRLG